MGKRWRDEDGTTLAELLVVIVLLGFIGAVTTTGIVTALRGQVEATNVATTLDGTRIATQRVRDVVRGADEVCSTSTSQQLVLWTDAGALDGVVQDSEITVFELVDTGIPGEKIFQRRVPDGSGTVQLIRDDIIDSLIFDYGTSPPEEQPTDLVCVVDPDDGSTLTPDGTGSRTLSVDLTFEVDNPSTDPTAPNLVTATAIRLRNAGLIDPEANSIPTADITFSCNGSVCQFDGTGSSDSDGAITDYGWEFATGASDPSTVVTPQTSTEASPSASYLQIGTYTVTLTVTDNGGATATTTAEVPISSIGSVNTPPLADFTVDCNFRACSFVDTSTDADGASDIDAWQWTRNSVVFSTTQNAFFDFPTNGTYPIELTVTDSAGGSSSKLINVVASDQAFIVSTVTKGSSVQGNSWTAELQVQLANTGAGDPGNGVTVSGTFGATAVSCGTNGSGRCTLKRSSIPDTTTCVQVDLTSLDKDGRIWAEEQDLVDFPIYIPRIAGTEAGSCPTAP